MPETRKLSFRDMGDRALFIDAVYEAMQASQEFSFSDSTDAKLCAYLYSKELNFRVYFYNTPCYFYNGKKCRGVLISVIGCLTYRDNQVDFIPEEEFNNLTLDDVPTLITKWQLIAVF